ncbi:somatostatin receptor type 2-like [Saccoglossus kowalevskii]|uniref:Somatostatin receptor type 2-like n=1 Tax=Saccoglossus kowalevskii TaxID=10224 RepID=A0ABM0M745_SACKO|nr:PREDICTED: somatostatin receptor type 2-like [Saccoglossus kowalevskii]
MSHVMNFTEGLGKIQYSNLPLWVFDIAIPMFAAVVFLVGVIGNGVVILTMLRYKKMRKSVTNIYILNLALADFFFFLVLPFVVYFNSSFDWIFGEVMCKLTMGLDGMNMFTGIFTLTSMAVDRYRTIVRLVDTRSYRRISIAKFTCIGLWVVSLLITLPLWFYAEVEPRRDNILVCTIPCPVAVKYGFMITAFILGFVAPLVIVCVCYTWIVTFLRNRKQSLTITAIKIGRISTLVFVTTGVFACSWLPFWIVRIALLATPNEEPTKSMETAYYSSLCLTFANGCLDPFIYACFKEDIYQKIRKLCSCFKRVTKPVESHL